MIDIDTFLTQSHEQIEKQLCALLSSSSDLPCAPLFASARYSLLSPGKRLRPLLVLATCASYGVAEEAALGPACALEMIHTYSLIHDDLPCMDDDALRRGKPTLHKVVPEWHALLTGDYLLTYAFEILADAPHLSARQKIALVKTLSSRAGAGGMIGGQMIDLLYTGQAINWDILEQMHSGKTASLMTAALEFGGIIAQAPEEDMRALQSTGLAMGTAFQLIDDLLDYTGTQEELGKEIGSDKAKSKATAISLLGAAPTQEKATQLLHAAKEHLNTLSCPAPLLHALLDLTVNRRK